MMYEEPEKLALRIHLMNEYKEESLYLEDIEEMDYDFYGAPLFSWNNEEYAIIDNDDIEYIFKQYAEDLIDDVVICELPESYRGYFDYDKFIQDMSFDGYGQMAPYDGNDNEIFLDGECYHILRTN